MSRYARIPNKLKKKIKRHAAKHPFEVTAKKFGISATSAWRIYHSKNKQQ